MGPGRAYGGDSKWLTGYFMGTLYYWATHGGKCWHPQMHPFIVGDCWNRIPADDVFGVITPNAPSARSSGWCIWHHGPGNACWQYAISRAQPLSSMLHTGVNHNQGLWSWLRVHWEIPVQKGYGAICFTVTYTTHTRSLKSSLTTERLS